MLSERVTERCTLDRTEDLVTLCIELLKALPRARQSRRSRKRLLSRYDVGSHNCNANDALNDPERKHSCDSLHIRPWTAREDFFVKDKREEAHSQESFQDCNQNQELIFTRMTVKTPQSSSK